MCPISFRYHMHLFINNIVVQSDHNKIKKWIRNILSILGMKKIHRMLKITVTLDQQLYQGDAVLQEIQAHVACLLPLSPGADRDLALLWSLAPAWEPLLALCQLGAWQKGWFSSIGSPILPANLSGWKAPFVESLQHDQKIPKIK